MTDQPTSVQLNQVSDDIRDRMRADMRQSLNRHGVNALPEHLTALLEDLVADGMHPVEHLLVENEQLVVNLGAAMNEAAQLRVGRMR